MNLSMELIFSIVIQLVAIGVYIGMCKTHITIMQEQIRDLKIEMQKYNNVLTRLAVAENSLKALHHRLDEKE